MQCADRTREHDGHVLEESCTNKCPSSSRRQRRKFISGTTPNRRRKQLAKHNESGNSWRMVVQCMTVSAQVRWGGCGRGTNKQCTRSTDCTVTHCVSVTLRRTTQPHDQKHIQQETPFTCPFTCSLQTVHPICPSKKWGSLLIDTASGLHVPASASDGCIRVRGDGTSALEQHWALESRPFLLYAKESANPRQANNLLFRQGLNYTFAVRTRFQHILQIWLHCDESFSASIQTQQLDLFPRDLSVGISTAVHTRELENKEYSPR